LLYLRPSLYPAPLPRPPSPPLFPYTTLFRSLAVRWRRYVRQPVTAPALVERKRVYVAVGDRSLRCLKHSSGKPIWRQRTGAIATDRKSTRLNSSHDQISYAVFCLKKKNIYRL